MIPLRESVLRLSQIAKYWARELGGIRTDSEIHAELLGVFWRGILPAVTSEGGGRIDPKRMLRAVNLDREHPGFTLVEGADWIPPSKEELPDGGVIIHLQRYIVLPADPALWSDPIIGAACEQLAEVPFEGFNPLVLPGLNALGATKEAIGDFCDQRGYPRPRFWFGTTPERPKSFGGRTSVMREIKAELRRRAEAGQLAPTLREEARALRDWAETNISAGLQIPQVRAIENALRSEYRRLHGLPWTTH